MIKRTKLFTAGLLCLIALVTPFPVVAQTSAEIQAQIDAQNAKLKQVQSNLSAAQSQLQSYQNQLNSVSGTIPKLEAQINQISSQISYNQLQIQNLAEEQKLKQLEQQEMQLQQDKAIKNAYVGWRSVNDLNAYISGDGANNLKSEEYQSSVFKVEGESLDQIAADIVGIQGKLSDYQNQTDDLNKQNTQLAAQKQQLQAQILALQGSVNSSSGAVAGLRTQQVTLQANIRQLSQEQKAVQLIEAALLQQGGTGGGTKVLTSGQIYFTGIGNYSKQGHGVGMSQYGAYAGAQNGQTAAQIIAHYYANTHIETRPGTINVQGYGTMDINRYAAGEGEVPGSAFDS